MVTRVDKKKCVQHDAINESARHVVMARLSSRVRDQFTSGYLHEEYLLEKDEFRFKMALTHNESGTIFIVRGVLPMEAGMREANILGVKLGKLLTGKIERFVQREGKKYFVRELKPSSFKRITPTSIRINKDTPLKVKKSVDQNLPTISKDKPKRKDCEKCGPTSIEYPEWGACPHEN